MNIVLLMLIHPDGKTDQINSYTTDSLGDAFAVFMDWATGINDGPLSPKQEAKATLTCRFGPVPSCLSDGQYIVILSWNCDTLI